MSGNYCRPWSVTFNGSSLLCFALVCNMCYRLSKFRIPLGVNCGLLSVIVILYYMSRGQAISTISHMHPAKPQISLRIRAVWSESLLTALRYFGSWAIHRTYSFDSDQTAQMDRLIWIFPWRTWKGCSPAQIGTMANILAGTWNKRPMGHDSLIWYKQLLHVCEWHATSASIATATTTQIWPFRINVNGYSSIIIWTNLLDIESRMLYTKIQAPSFLSSGAEDF